MKNKTTVLLIFTALCLQSIHLIGMDEMPQSQESKIDQVKGWAINLVRKLKTYKKCIKSEEGCPPELKQELRNAGLKVGVGIAAVLGTIAFGYGLKKGIDKLKAGNIKNFRAQSALKEAELQESDLNDFEKRVFTALMDGDLHNEVFYYLPDGTPLSSDTFLQQLKNPKQFIYFMQIMGRQIGNDELIKFVSRIATKNLEKTTKQQNEEL